MAECPHCLVELDDEPGPPQVADQAAPSAPDAETDIEAAFEALWSYVGHLASCDAFQPLHNPDKLRNACDCGLEDAKEQARRFVLAQRQHTAALAEQDAELWRLRRIVRKEGIAVTSEGARWCRFCGDGWLNDADEHHASGCVIAAAAPQPPQEPAR